MEESICARQRDLWGTSIFSRAFMHDKTRNKIKPEPKKIPKTTPPTSLGKVQKKISVKPQLYIIQVLCRDNETAEQAAVIMLLGMKHFRYQAQQFSLGMISQVAENIFLVKTTEVSQILFFLYFGHSGVKQETLGSKPEVS